MVDRIMYYAATKILFGILTGVVTTQNFIGPAIAQHPGYRFEKLVTTANPDFQLFPEQSPKITDDGRVLFFARRPVSGSDGAYFFGDDQSQDLIVAWSASFGSLFSPRQLNEFGDFVFIEDLGPTANQLYYWSPNKDLAVLYAGTGGPDSLRFLDSDQPAINNSGDVVFIADGQGFGSDTVFRGSLKGELPVDVVASAFDGFSRFFSVFIADSGDVIARADRSGNRGIFKFTTDGQILELATVGEPFEFITEFDANCNGQILFGGTVAGTSVLYLGDEDGLDLVVAEDSTFTLVQGLAVNDQQSVVFAVRVFGDLGGGRTLQIGPDIVDDRLLGAGDTIFGHTIQNVSAGVGSINDSGQIAFQASWTEPGNGTFGSGIIIATPILFGDLNMDEAVNLLDVAPFATLIVSGNFQAEADLNNDGVVNMLDVGPFVEILVGP